MKLHYHPVSPYARKAYVAMLHRGDEAVFHRLDLRAGELRSEGYLRLSPFGKMPVLETDEGPIVESTSIIEWLEDRGPRVLLPRGAERVARHWDRLGDLYLTDAQSTIWFEPGTPQAQRAEQTATTAFRLFDERLAGRSFVCGEHFTMGDIGGAIATDYLERLGLSAPHNVRAWRDRCFAVPAMSRALDEALPIVEGMLAARAAPLAPA